MSRRTAARSRTPDPNVADVARRTQELQATPGNVDGTASRSSGSGIVDLHQKGIEEPIATDLQKFQLTSADAMLKMLLRKVLIKQDAFQDDEALLKEYLSAVLPVCNDTKVKQHLDQYCTKEDEVGRYQPFIQCFNTALKKLEAIPGQLLRPLPASEQRILLCRNDPQPILANYGGVTTTVKPDVVITTLRAAKARWAYKEDYELSYTQATELAPDPPQPKITGTNVVFTWDHALSTKEFKAVVKKLQTKTRKRYDATLQMPNIPAFEDVRAMVPPGKLPAPPKPQRQPASSGNKGKTEALRASDRARTAQDTAQKKLQEEDRQATVKAKPILDSQPSAKNRLDLPPMVQTGTYAANLLSRRSIISHVINFTVIDAVVWIWWHDREGAIQSSGIDFIQDLPRFLVLLLALQRFSLEDWGFVPGFDSVPKKIHLGQTTKDVLRFDDPRLPSIDIRQDSIPLYHRYTLLGRGTLVLSAGQPAGKGQYVVKLSWPDSTRTDEHGFVRHLRQQCANLVHEVIEHLPRIQASRSHADQSTETIRKALGVRPRERRVPLDNGTEQVVPIQAHRVLRSVVSEKLETTENVAEAEFLKITLDIALCHYLAWTIGGVHHRDLSLANFMYTTNDEGEKLGVLNDWDLATFADSRHDGLERTGTIPYMAIDLLLPESMAGTVQHLYRHDLEALFWVLVWVCSPPGAFSNWESGTYRQCRKEKSDFLQEGEEFPVREGYLGLSLVVDELKSLFKKIDTASSDRRYEARKFKKAGMPLSDQIPEETSQQIWQRFCQSLRHALAFVKHNPQHAALAKVLENFLTYAPQH